MDATDFEPNVETPSTLHTGTPVGPDSKKLAGLLTNKTNTKALAMALVALGLVAGGVVIGPRLIGSPPSPVAARPLPRRAAQAAVDEAEALIRDAQFDLDHTRIAAPFTGRIGSHLVSVGNLVAGSRAGTSPTTLLATLVSFETIYLDFDMSEAEYMIFARERQRQTGPLASRVKVSLSDEQEFTRVGTLDFVDNSLDRSSGTIHARATVPNSDLLLTPGGFARVRLEVAPPEPALLVPDASVLPDQSQHIVLTVDANNVVTPKQVELGDLRDGLRVIRSGLAPTDKVIIDGIPSVAPGGKVSPHDGSIRFASQQSEK
jgi:RND family efflux transporter MFP subunit